MGISEKYDGEQDCKPWKAVVEIGTLLNNLCFASRQIIISLQGGESKGRRCPTERGKGSPAPGWLLGARARVLFPSHSLLRGRVLGVGRQLPAEPHLRIAGRQRANVRPPPPMAGWQMAHAPNNFLVGSLGSDADSVIIGDAAAQSTSPRTGPIDERERARHDLSA